MLDFTKYVNVFQGNSTVVNNDDGGISSAWAPIKGLSGNTHPGAQLPFGKVSVCAYSGGYPTGYGNNKLNCGEPVEPLYKEKSVLGVAHLQHSGTGAVGFYYNYALTTPFSRGFDEPELNTLIDEVASPGYYSARFKEKDIKFELTTDKNSALHRYYFNDNNRNVSVDLSNNGLYSDYRLRHKAGDATLRILDKNSVAATVILEGLPLHFCVHCNSGEAVLWNEYKIIEKTELITDGEKSTSFGFLFKDTDKIAEITVCISLKSQEAAIENCIASSKKCFDDVKSESALIWNEHLSKILVTGDEKQKEIFYSNLYHTLVKPSDWSGESIYYDDKDFVIDFTTLWDIYKTQLPLLFTVYKDISEKIVNTYLSMGKNVGVMPNLFDLSSSFSGEAQQARFLAGYLFCDAFYRGIGNIDGYVLELLKELLIKTEEQFFENGECSRTTHTLDMAEACTNLINIARLCGCYELFEDVFRNSENWKNAFDSDTGILKADSEYYEGNHWNYSFRPMNSMKERIEIAGGNDRFTRLLDKFFGFVDKDDKSARFEGFNNETDMEAPYAYNYVGRQDRLSEILKAASKNLFTDGEGGAPGNVDSGGLSACYIWNCLGVFPVSGQDLMLIGMPESENSTVKLSNGREFKIARIGDGEFVKRAVLNGIELSNLRFKATDMMNGGKLELYTL